MRKDSEPNNLLRTPEERAAAIQAWLEIVSKESLLPVVNPDVLKDTLRLCIEKNISPRFVVTLCPVFENIVGSEGGPTRRILPFSPNIPRLEEFVKEIASLIVGVKTNLKVNPNVLIIINDVFESGDEERIENIKEAREILGQGKKVLHTMFQRVDERNPQIWSHRFQSSLRIVSQSDFVKPLKRLGLPSHENLIKELIKESLDPKTDAFRTWLWFLENTRGDPLMTPNAWQNEKSAKALHERVRFLVGIYWIDSIVNAMLFKTIFQEKKPGEEQLLPIFICGVTRKLQAEMEMKGVNLKLSDSGINKFKRIQDFRKQTAAIHVLKNTAMWSETSQDPFSCAGRCILV